MTYEKVLEVFGDYLSKDKDSEVLNTSRGYLVLMWESCFHNWLTTKLAQSPEDLRDLLQERYEDFLSYKITQDRERHPDKKEQEEIKRMGEELAARC